MNTFKEAPTPETDAEAPNGSGFDVDPDFARRLERERDEVRLEVQRLESVISQAYEANQNLHCYRIPSGRMREELDRQTRILMHDGRRLLERKACEGRSDFEARLEQASRGAEGYESILPNTIYERFEDMSPDGKLQLIVQEDGDICVAVITTHQHRGFQCASVEFCMPGSGGGRSRHTLAALRQLILAIQKDNEEYPIVPVRERRENL